MRKIYVIGIGAGDPDQLTVQAVRALNQVDVFFLIDKGPGRAGLAGLRHEILRRHVRGHSYRLVTVVDPERDRGAGDAGEPGVGSPPGAYSGAVHDWRSRRAGLYERMITDELGEEPGDARTAAFLVWGDPSLYDPTLSVLDEVLERGRVRFDQEVIPGVSSVSALAAGHRIGLNRVAGAVQITTGRRLAAEGWPEGVDDVVVLLDAHQSFLRQLGTDPFIYWGAYVGTEDEILVSGRLSEVAERIVELRAAARERKGWIMDSYLLRRGEAGPGTGA